MHKPFRIYGECAHKDDDHERLGIKPLLVGPDDFWTCEEAFEYEICKECCTDGEFQTEECSEHSHGKGKPICSTAAILDRHTS